MTDLAPLPDLPGGPHDLEFFFDPACPFAWQTSVWVRRVAELRDLSVGWRFISLAHINRDRDNPAQMVDGHRRGLRYLRICAAARDRHGNDAVGALYEGWGRRHWYEAPTARAVPDRTAAAASRIDPAEILSTLDLDADLAEAADSESWDDLIRHESDVALERTGPDVGTPIITFGPPEGASIFGPVISTIPDDETLLAIYDATVTLVGYPGFSELKRSARARFDLPLFARFEG
jgi:hypothetical protein